jgi:hypothetical protein
MSRSRLLLYALLAAGLVLALIGIVREGRDPALKGHDGGLAAGSGRVGSAAGKGGIDPITGRPRSSARVLGPRGGRAASSMARVTVTGAVRRYRDHRPVAGATLVFRQRDGARERVAASSDATGRYQARLVPGRHELSVRAAGYAGRRAPEQLLVMEDGFTPQLHVSLYERVSVRGQVVDLRGQPVAGAQISVVRATHRSGVELAGASTSAPSKVISASDGRFAFALPPGRVTLKIREKANEQLLGPLELADAAALPAGVAGLRVTLGGGLTLTGQVLGPARQRLTRGGGELLLRDELGTRRVGLDAEGRFKVGGLAPGRKLLQAQAPGFGPSRVVALTLAKGSGNNARLTLARLRRVSGKVIALGTSAGGTPQPVGGARIAARPITPGGQATWLLPAARTVSAVDGSYSLEAVADLPLALVALAPDGRRARRLGVAPGSRDVRLPLSATGGVAGIVTDSKRGKGLPSFTLRVERAGAEPEQLRVISRAGRYAVSGLAQGVVTLTFTAAAMAPKQRQRLSLIGGVNVQADVALDGAGRVVGRVRDSRGVALPGVAVRVAASSTRTDGLGRYQLRDAPRGRRELSFSRQGYLGQTANGVSIFAGQQGRIPTVTLAARGGGAAVPLVGPGLVLTVVKGVARVERVEGPAQRAGVRAGDALLALDGQLVAGKQLADVQRRLRGLPHTALALRVSRGQGKTKKTIEIGVLRGR